MARRGQGVSNWTVVLGAALLLAVAAIVWVLASRTTDQAEDLTVPPVELPDAPIPPGPTPTPDPPSIPTPGPT